MKKIILSVALAALMGGTAFAQSATNNQTSDNTTCTAACGTKQDKCASLFEGLNLTEAQKTQLDALKAQNAQQRQKDVKEAREARDAKKEAKQNFRKENLAKIKAILTPEQYVQFLENAYLNQGKMNKDGRKAQARDGRKDGKGGKDVRSAGNGQKADKNGKSDKKDKRDGQRPDRKGQNRTQTEGQSTK